MSWIHLFIWPVAVVWASINVRRGLGAIGLGILTHGRKDD